MTTILKYSMILIAIALILFVPSALSADTAKIFFSGKISDDSGQTVKANVSAFVSGTENMANSSVSDPDGYYLFSVDPGQYDVKFSLPVPFIPDFWLKIWYLNLISNSSNMITNFTTSENKISIIFDDDDTNMTMMTMKSHSASSVYRDGKKLIKYDSLDSLMEDGWYHDSASDMLYVKFPAQNKTNSTNNTSPIQNPIENSTDRNSTGNITTQNFTNQNLTNPNPNQSLPTNYTYLMNQDYVENTILLSKRTDGSYNNDLIQTTTAIMDLQSINKSIPDSDNTVSYYDNAHQNWAGIGNFYWETRVWWALAGYDELNATPSPDANSSLQNILANIETWDEAINDTRTYSATNFWGGLWARTASWHLTYNVEPSWISDFYNLAESDKNSWMYDLHQRTHVLFVYYMFDKPMPFLDEAVSLTISEQQPDGSWTGPRGGTIETREAISLLSISNYSTPEVINALNKSRNWLSGLYRQETIDGKIYEGFTEIGGSTISYKSTLSFVPTAIDLGLLKGTPISVKSI